MKKTICYFISALFVIATYAQKADLVNPFVGTDGHGHTYPGVSAPFGQLQVSPDTRLSGWDGCSGYHYSDSVIYGFSNTHLSGTGVEDLCDILLTPTVHSRHWKDVTLKFSHDNESAIAGSYTVTGFNKSFITTELAATKRLAHHNYTYPAGDTMAIVINLKHRDKTLDWNVELRDSRTVAGYRKSKSWNENQDVYFVALFSTNIADSYLDTANGLLYLYFGKSTPSKNAVYTQVALSSVSKQGALKNLEREKFYSFYDARKESIYLWEKALSVIDVEGGTKQQRRTFYTALYHCMLAPNLYSDVDYKYRRMVNNNIDAGKKIDMGNYASFVAQAEGYDRYTTFSLWDTYRSWNSLMTIINPKICLDFEKTFLDYYRQTDELPMWELQSWETYCMIGAHGISVLAEWIKKGIVTDNETALRAMIATANKQERGLEFFNKHGYISSEQEHESVSKTVEYAYNMYCIAETAKLMGKEDIYNEYSKRAQYYKNLFNPNNKFIQPKENGRFIPDFDPKQVDINYTEGNGWQYTFYVPHDMNTLINLMGGDEAFEKKLDECFESEEDVTGRQQADVTGLIGQYAHGNEPSQHMAYLYTYVGKPYKTQRLVRRILTELYDDTPEGLCGNEDCGQMSAWYVMSAMGLYPVNPVSGQYVIGSPLFDKVTVHLQNGKDFVIKSKQGKNTPFIKKIKLNGKEYKKLFVNHKDIVSGGKLDIKMTDEGGYNASHVNTYARPSATINAKPIQVMPYLEYEGTGAFSGNLNVKVKYLNNDLTLKETQNRILQRTEDIKLSNTKNANGGNTVTAKFFKIKEGRSVELKTPYSPQYPAGGQNALIDNKTGSENWRLGAWQGYWGEDVEAVIDLSGVRHISSVGGHFIQDERSWIFMPLQTEYYASEDGENFTLLGIVENDISEKQPGIITKTFTLNTSVDARYIKMKAINRKTNPKGHLSEGEKAWLFIDEIFIK